MHPHQSSISLLAAAMTLIISSSLLGQEHNFSTSLKVYSVFSWYDHTTVDPLDAIETNKKLEFGRIVPALEFRYPTGHFHELSLTRLLFDHSYQRSEEIILGNSVTVDGETRDNFNLAVNYGYHLNLAKKSNRIHPYFGASITPSLYTEVIRPMVSNIYKQRIFITSLNMYLVPRLIIDISESFFLDIKIPFSPGNLYYRRVRTDNPNLPIEERTTASLGFNSGGVLDQFVCQVGFGVKLN